MALTGRNCVFMLLLLATVCLQFQHAQHVFGRCLCHNTVKIARGNMSDFQVYERRPGCDKTELIITLSGMAGSMEQKCIDTQTRMATAFLKCWERINKDNSRKKECLDKKRRAEDRPTEDRPTEGRATEGTPTEGRPTEDRPREGRPTEGRPTEGTPTEGRPTEDRPREGRPTEGTPREGRPTEDRPTEGKPTEDRPTEGRPTESRPREEGSGPV